MSDNLRELAEAASDGPWFVTDSPRRAYIAKQGGGLIMEALDGYGAGSDGARANAAYIAAAHPQAILALIDERDALRKALVPFANAGDDGRGSALQDDAPLAIVNANRPDLPQWLAKVRGVVTQGDIRRARAALSKEGR